MENSIPYLYNKIWRGDVPREGAEVDSDSSLLMGCQLGIVLVIQGDAGKCPSDSGWVTGVHLLENNWKEMWETKARETAREWGTGMALGRRS